ncbi:unnamed protein product [Polarella glacialis]|uniref:Uncharacterized protein n=1 Tax=Polarella glacialis TaxID=89957 RepID=A0A813HAY4_POLGL|nr:unnamed protein product [Polarella glacialis]CAE8653433.1 unnamed protein product [Polarella glacialis]
MYRYLLPIAATLAAKLPQKQQQQRFQQQCYQQQPHQQQQPLTGDFWNYDQYHDYDAASDWTTTTTTPTTTTTTIMQRQWSFTTYNAKGFRTRTMHEVLSRIGSDIICLEAAGARWGGFL